MGIDMDFSDLNDLNPDRPRIARETKDELQKVKKRSWKKTGMIRGGIGDAIRRLCGDDLDADK